MHIALLSLENSNICCLFTRVENTLLIFNIDIGKIIGSVKIYKN